MSWNPVASTSVRSTTGGPITSPAIDTTGSDLLVIVLSEWVGGTPSTPTDSKGNTWTQLTRRSSGGPEITIWYAKNAIVGSDHTFSYDAGFVFASLAVLAYSGSDLTDPFDQENGATGSSLSILQTSSVTPTENGELLVAGLATEGTEGTVSINSEFTLRESEGYNAGTNFGVAAADLIQGAAAAVNPQWTWDSAIANAAAAIATFKAATAGGTFTGTLAATAGAATFSGSAEFDAPTFTGTLTATAAAASFAGSAEFDAPVYMGALTATAGGSVFFGSATFDESVSLGVLTLTSGAAVFFGTATITAPTFDAPIVNLTGHLTRTASLTGTLTRTVSLTGRSPR